MVFWYSLESMSSINTALTWIVGTMAFIVIILEHRVNVLQDREDAVRDKRHKETEEVARKLRMQNQTRRLTDDQMQNLRAALAEIPKGPISVNFVADNMEAKNYAAQFKEAFAAAGFEIIGHGPFSFGSGEEYSVEIGCAESAPDYAIALENALNTAGFPFRSHTLTNQRVAPWVNVSIGPKPRIET